MAVPPPNLPIIPSLPAPGSSGTDSIRRGLPGALPGGGADAPDPFEDKTKVGAARPAFAGQAPAAPEPAPLPPPAFRQPRSPQRGRRTTLLLLSSFIVLILLGVVGFVAFRLLFSGSGEGQPSPTPSQAPTGTPSTTPEGSPEAAGQVADPDADGLTNAEEAFYRTDAQKADTDGDGFTDSQEVRAGYDPLGPGKLDSDNDGFPDPDEREFGSDPFNPDTDGDGYNDGAEIKNGYNPLIPSPGDKL